MGVTIRRVLMLSAALSMAACVSKPTMQLDHAQVSSVAPGGIYMTIFLKVNNPNSFDVEVRNVRVQSVVQGRWALPPVQYSPNQWLPADGTTIVQAPVLIPWSLVLPLLAESAASPTIQYRVQGSVDVTAIRSLGVRSDNYPVDETGSIPRSAVLAAARSTFPFAR